MERILSVIATLLLTVFIVILILQDKANVVPIFATLGLCVAALGCIDYDDV